MYDYNVNIKTEQQVYDGYVRNKFFINFIATNENTKNALDKLYFCDLVNILKKQDGSLTLELENIDIKEEQNVYKIDK